MELWRTLPFNVLLLARVSEGNADSVNSMCSNAAFPITSSNLRYFYKHQAVRYDKWKCIIQNIGSNKDEGHATMLHVLGKNNSTGTKNVVFLVTAGGYNTTSTNLRNQGQHYQHSLFWEKVPCEQNYLELLPFNWWTRASNFLKSVLGWPLFETNESTLLKCGVGKEVPKETWLLGLKMYNKTGNCSALTVFLWKKRVTTSTTKSGLLSSWSCWSWLNCSSRKPFLKKNKDSTTVRNNKEKQKADNPINIAHEPSFSSYISTVMLSGNCIA